MTYSPSTLTTSTSTTTALSSPRTSSTPRPRPQQLLLLRPLQEAPATTSTAPSAPSSQWSNVHGQTMTLQRLTQTHCLLPLLQDLNRQIQVCRHQLRRVSRRQRHEAQATQLLIELLASIRDRLRPPPLRPRQPEFRHTRRY